MYKVRNLATSILPIFRAIWRRSFFYYECRRKFLFQSRHTEALPIPCRWEDRLNTDISDTANSRRLFRSQLTQHASGGVYRYFDRLAGIVSKHQKLLKYAGAAFQGPFKTIWRSPARSELNSEYRSYRTVSGIRKPLSMFRARTDSAAIQRD